MGQSPFKYETLKRVFFRHGMLFAVVRIQSKPIAIPESVGILEHVTPETFKADFLAFQAKKQVRKFPIPPDGIFWVSSWANTVGWASYSAECESRYDAVTIVYRELGRNPYITRMRVLKVERKNGIETILKDDRII